MTTKRLLVQWMLIPAAFALLAVAGCLYKPTFNVFPGIKTDLTWPASQPTGE